METGELADEYGRICAKYLDPAGHVRGDERYLFLTELALALRVGGAHGEGEQRIRELAWGGGGR
jgi:hypothetical protein